MKKTAFTLALLAVTVTAGAQRNDLYSTGKSGKTAVPVQTVKQVTPVQTATVAKSSSADAFDADNYNRRYTSAPTAVSYEDETDYYNPVYVHDTVFMMLESQSQPSYDSHAYNEGYTDAVEDFYATRLITRFHRRGLTLSLALDPYYYDSWYWDSWYYDPFYYDWYYDRYYYGYRYYDSWYYRPYRYYYSYSRPVYVDRHYATAPNRHVNSGRGSGWDRNLSGRNTYATRSVSSGSRRVSEPSRNVSNRNVAAQHSAERRGVSTSGGRTVTGTNTRSVNSSTGSRSVNSSTGYDRPSSTDSRNVSSGTRNVSRSVSGNSTRNAGTGNRGENVQSRPSVTPSGSSTGSRSVSSGSSSRSVSSGSSSRSSSSSGSPSRSVSSGSSRGVSGSASRR